MVPGSPIRSPVIALRNPTQRALWIALKLFEQSAAGLEFEGCAPPPVRFVKTRKLNWPGGGVI